jgi:taurine dioxygenase
MKITPTGGALGADVTGLDLRETLGPAAQSRLREAFRGYSLLRLRGQQLTRDDLVRFSTSFGEPVVHPTNHRDRDPQNPLITIISNIEEDGRALGALGNAELKFHADLVFLHTPGSVSILYCVECPSGGGDTYWSNAYRAYDTLDASMRERIAGLKVVYVHRNPAYNPPQPPAHPIVCTHPDTHRKMLFVSPSSAQGIVGLGQGEGQSLLKQLLEHATQDSLVLRHQWQVGDVMVWDNRCTLHRRDAFDHSARRLMWRTQLLGPLSL